MSRSAWAALPIEATGSSTQSCQILAAQAAGTDRSAISSRPCRACTATPARVSSSSSCGSKPSGAR
jgi:hypothetical protein